MYCPRCGVDQPLGTRRCSNCGALFSRQANGRRQALVRSPAPRTATASYRTYRRSSGVGRSLLGWLAFLVVAAILVLAAASFLSSAVVKPYVGRMVDENFDGELLDPGIIEAVDAPVVSADGEQVVITQDELNAQIAEHADQLGPLDRARVEITGQEIVVHLSAYGVSGRYRGKAVAENGTVVVRDGKVDGMLGWAVSAEQLEAALNREIGAAIDKSNVTVQDVQTRAGQLVLTVAGEPASVR